MVSTTYLSHKPRGWLGSLDRLGFKLFHGQAGHNETDGRTYGCTLYLFTILTLEGEIGVFEEELQQCDDMVYEHPKFQMQLCVLLQLVFDYGGDSIHRNRCEKGLHIKEYNALPILQSDGF